MKSRVIANDIIMTSPSEYSGILLAKINIEKDMSALGYEDRMAVAQMCNVAVASRSLGLQYTPGAEKFSEYIGKFEGESTGVQIVVCKEAILIHCEEYLVSHLKIGDLKVMVTFPNSEANLAIVGRCTMKGRDQALFFNLLSDQLAEKCIQAIAKDSLKEMSDTCPQKTTQQTVSKALKRIALPLPKAMAGSLKPLIHSTQSTPVSITSKSSLPNEGPLQQPRKISPLKFIPSLKKTPQAESVLGRSTVESCNPKLELPPTAALVNKTVKRPLPLVPSVFVNAANNPLPPSPKSVVNFPSRNHAGLIPFKRDPPVIPNKPSPSVCYPGHHINKPLKPPKPNFMSKSDSELQEKGHKF